MIPFPYLSAHPTGSRYTVQPAVLTTDDDWLVLVEDLKEAESRMGVIPGTVWTPWQRCFHPYSPEMEPGSWSAWRNGDLNLIVTDDRTLYLRKVAATLLCAKLNLTDKQDRIDLFRAVQDGGAYTGRLP